MTLGQKPDLEPQRALRWAMLSSLRVLRHSIHHRRPMSLPNLLRLFRRKLAMIESPMGGAAQIETRLSQLYRKHQPFSAGRLLEYPGCSSKE